MEFVGKTVRKDFKGFGVFAGVVNSYNPSTGFFEIVYEDGDSEDLELSEVASLMQQDDLGGGVVPAPQSAEKQLPTKKPSKVGRKPKRRRRSSATAVAQSQSAQLLQESVVGDLGNDSTFLTDNALSLDKTLEMSNLGANGYDIDNAECLAVVAKRSRNDGGLDLNLSDVGEAGMVMSNDLRGSDAIDLNLDLNVEENWDSVVVQAGSSLGNAVVVKKEHYFDLNLGLDDENKNLDDGSYDGTPGMSKEAACVREVEGIHMNDGGSSENCLGDGIFHQSLKTDASVGVLDGYFVQHGNAEVHLKDLSVSGEMSSYGIQVSAGKPQQEKKVRKRRKLSEYVTSAAETVLRRSTRKGRPSSSSAEAHIHSLPGFEEVNDGLFSPAISVISEDQPSISGRVESDELSVLPSKLQLPPSSTYLNLDGIPVLDLFSVYAFLRSFSTLLFLSPFKLEDFVASLRCSTPTLLIDYIHLSLLQTLRKHLEFLSDESPIPASNCLRDLNWDFLDLITWPVFMVEYFVMRSSAIKPGFDLCHLRLFENDYYKQPESVKVDILRCLCDDVIEVEAVKCELNRRTMNNEPTSNKDFEWSTKLETFKKRKAAIDISGSSCVTEDFVEEATDWNGDECCLCKMDGSLICCDGCPSAFHARCVGVATNLLPEGDWYCPECVIDRDNPWMKVGKSLRGAELLGIDPYGRLYYGSCGYLLVSDPCDAESSCHYYHKNDMTVVIEALGSSASHYSSILSAITKQWDVFSKVIDAKYGLNLDKFTLNFEPLMNGQLPATTVPPMPLSSETCAMDETVNEGKPGEICISSPCNRNTRSKIPELVSKSVSTRRSMKIGNPLATSEGSDETSQSITHIQNYQQPALGCSERWDGIFGDQASAGNISLISNNINMEQLKNIQSKNQGCTSSKVSIRVETPFYKCANGYVNFYSFARTAWSVAEKLTHKSSDKITQETAKSVEELMSTQLKAISNASNEFCWSNIQNLNSDARKEKCGWCIACKVPDYESDCLFVINNSTPALENFTSDLLGLHSKKNSKGHIVDVMCHILCIEDRLHGLISGPWLNPHFPELWRKSFLTASDMASVKKLLLLLELNIRPLALSADWLKHVDSVATVGSASHIVISSARVPSKHVIGRKRARGPDLEPKSSSNGASGLGLLWWRGGRLSRQLFNWKGLPRSFASKAARQGGCKKIPGVLYPDSSEFAKRSKYDAWRSSVERSVSAEQLAVMVRELDANIRWDAIENINCLPSMDKESQKSIRSFKKVIIRRKAAEGGVVKYLLDFGKRRFIPDVVAKHGSKLEESSSERKRYWLVESYVPLHLLKSFEEKRIARKSNETGSGKLLVSGRLMKKSSKKEAFSYLFSKAERSENYQCGHCKKDVLIREAVCCQFCEGFFHKRHVKKSAGTTSSKCKYTCHKCHGGKHVKVDANKGKSQLQMVKKASKARPGRPKMSKNASKGKKPAKSKAKKDVPVVVPLRRSARTAKVVLLPSKKVGRPKKGKQSKSKSKKVRTKKQKKDNLQKKRAQVYHTYWLNGLQLSRKPNDERAIRFRSKNHIAPFEQLTVIPNQPRCSLCHEQEFTSSLNYICCEICGDWFHGDAFGLKTENIDSLIGFKCHKCLNRAPPACPNFNCTGIVVVLEGEVKNDGGSECGEELSNGLAIPMETNERQTSHTVEESRNLTSTDMSIHESVHTGLVKKTTLDIDGALSPLSEKGANATLKLDANNLADAVMNQNENTLSNLELKTESTNNSDEICPESLLPTKNPLVADNLLSSTLVGTENALSESIVHISGADLILSGQNHANNGFLNSASNLKSEVNKPLVDSSEISPQEANLDSTGLDRCVD